MATIKLENKVVMVTRVAGFIGSYLCKRLLENIKGIKIIGVDCISDYYDIS